MSRRVLFTLEIMNFSFYSLYIYIYISLVTKKRNLFVKGPLVFNSRTTKPVTDLRFSSLYDCLTLEPMVKMVKMAI